MSITMEKADGVTVITVTSDPQSACPPLCQIIKGHCCPVCCSVPQPLKKVPTSSQSILGALHIIVGLFNIGLGVILFCSRGGALFQMYTTGFPFWMGALFILFGIICIVSEKCPSPRLVNVNMILNLAGVAFAIASIVLYSKNIAGISMWWLCEMDYFNNSPATLSPDVKAMKDQCLAGKARVLMLMRSVNAVLIVLSVLELCLVISSVVMSIKTLRSSKKGEDKKIGDPENCKPLLVEATSTLQPK